MIGHEIGHSCCLRNLIEGKANGELRKGSLRTCFTDAIVNEQTYAEIKEIIQGRISLYVVAHQRNG